MFRLREFSWLTGCAKWLGSADSIDGLPWAGIDSLNTYAVYLDDECLKEFEGSFADEARAGLEDYDV